MKKTLLIMMMATGCCSFVVHQKEETEAGRTVETRIRATAWFSSAQSLERIKATTTEKTQSFGGEGIGQQGATNSTEVLKAVADLIRAIPGK